MLKFNSTQMPWLTDFCDNLRIFISIVVLQIAVFIYSFGFLSFDFEYLRKLSVLTLLTQLVGITILIVLCKLRSFLNKLGVIIGVLALTLLIVFITTILAQLIGYLDLQLTFNLFDDQHAVNFINFKLTIASIIICLALIRYFYIQDQYNQQIQSLSDARIGALQARIKPHFLFNSLNSIASLISIDALRAEKAVTDFSSLMRRTFTYKDKTITIVEELKWIEQYLAIEKLRLDERLDFDISCEKPCEKKMIPTLSIQPLVENAIIHGIQPLEEGGLITIKILSDKNMLEITVTNPYINRSNSNSNGMALVNIRERLKLQYGAKATLTTQGHNGQFMATIKLPL
jgi:two-component system sensor histidine kinase AlgZ